MKEIAFFPLLKCLSLQYVSNTCHGIWQDHHLEMRCLTVHVSVTSYLQKLRNTAKITVHVLSKIILGIIFILLRGFCIKILMPEK